MLNWSPIPQKVIEKHPIYENNPKCPSCFSIKNFPIMNMPGSPLLCEKCNKTFSQKIIGYREIIIEK